MKQALIDPTTQVDALTSWTPNPDPLGKPKYFPVMTPIDNSARVAEVVPNGSAFPVAIPLFWTNCADDVVADQFLYEPNSKQIIKIELPTPKNIKTANNITQNF